MAPIIHATFIYAPWVLDEYKRVDGWAFLDLYCIWSFSGWQLCKVFYVFSMCNAVQVLCLVLMAQLMICERESALCTLSYMIGHLCSLYVSSKSFPLASRSQRVEGHDPSSWHLDTILRCSCRSNSQFSPIIHDNFRMNTRMVDIAPLIIWLV
jgi:hypothetical protein